MAAILSNGTTFTYDGGAVTEILSISTPSVTTATVDTTDMESVHRTFIAWTIDSGEMTLEIMYDPNADTDLEDPWDNTATGAPVAKACVITFPDAGYSTFTFQGIIVGFSASVAIDEKITASITIRVSGAITVAT